MASGNYVVGRDIDFQFGESANSSTSESSSQHSSRDSAALKAKSKKTVKRKPTETVCQREAAAAVSPRKQPKPSEVPVPKTPAGARVKRRIHKVSSSSPSSKPTPGSSSSGLVASKGASSTAQSLLPQAPSNMKKTTKASKSSQTSRATSSSAAHAKPTRQQLGSASISKAGKVTKRKQSSGNDHDEGRSGSRGHDNPEGFNGPGVWYSSSSEERSRVLQFWKQLSPEERTSLVSVDKDALFSLIQYKRKSCSCPVCDHKQEAVDEELDELFAINEPRLTKYAKDLQSKEAIFIESGLDNGIREYFQQSIDRSAEELNWTQPDFHSVSRFQTSLPSSEELPATNKGLFQELLQKPLSEINIGGFTSSGSDKALTGRPVTKLPEGAPSDIDTSAFPAPLAHLCNALMEIMFGEPRADLPSARKIKAKEFETRVLVQLRNMSKAASQSREPDTQATLSKQFLQIWTEMLSIYQLNRPRKRVAPSGGSLKTLTNAEIQQYAQDLAKPILRSSNDEIPSNTIKALMSLGPLCEAQGISREDQRRISFEMLRSGLSERYPRIVQALFSEFAQDVEHNNGSNLLQMLETLPANDPVSASSSVLEAISSATKDLDATVPSTEASGVPEAPGNELKRQTNETHSELAKYYEQVNGTPAFGDRFDMEISLANSESPPVVTTNPEPVVRPPGWNSDDTDDDPDGDSETPDNGPLDIDAEIEGNYTYNSASGAFEPEEAITEDVAVLEEQEANRLLQASYYLHYLFARLFEQRVLKAYREHVAKQRQLSLLAELAEEEAKAAIEANRKQREKDKKKSKKLLLKQQREEEAQRKALEAKRKAEKAEAAREKEAARRLQQLEQDREKQEAHRRKIEERMAQLAIEAKVTEKPSPVEPNSKTEAQSTASSSPAASTSSTSANTSANASANATTSKGISAATSSNPPALDTSSPAVQKASHVATAAALPAKKAKAKVEKMKTPEKVPPAEKVKPLEKAKPAEKSKPTEKPKSVEKPKVVAEKPKPEKVKAKTLEKVEPAKSKSHRTSDRPEFEIRKPEKANPPFGSASSQPAGMLNASPKITEREAPVDSPRYLGASNWLPNPQQGVGFQQGSTSLQSSSAMESLYPSSNPNHILGSSLPPGIGPLNPLQQPGSLGDFAGLSSNLGGGPYGGASRNQKLPPGPPPGMGSMPLQNPLSMGMGANIPSPNLGSPGLAGSALSGGMGGRLNGSVYPGFSMKPGGQGPGDNSSPLQNGTPGTLGNNMDAPGMLNMYRRQSQQPQQSSQQPHQLPQYSSVSSLWSPAGSGTSQGANTSWQRSPWNDDRVSDSAKLQQVTTPSPWGKFASSSLAPQQSSSIDISETVKRCYKDVQNLGVDGYVPSQVLYHAVQSKSGLRFNQNELYKACSRLPTFDCMRDSVGLITHIKL